MHARARAGMGRRVVDAGPAGGECGALHSYAQGYPKSGSAPEDESQSAVVPQAGPRDGNRVVTFYLIKEEIYPRDNVLVGDRFDGPICKQLHTIIAVGDDVVTRGGCQIQVLALLLDPVEGVVYGTEFPGIALGSPGQKETWTLGAISRGCRLHPER